MVLCERLPDGDGPALTRRLRGLENPPQVIVYTGGARAGASGSSPRVAGAAGVVDKEAEAGRAVRGRPRRGPAAGASLPEVTAAQLDAAAHLVDGDDLALLAMLVDRTPPGDVADALRLDHRRVQRRTERLLGQLRDRPSTGVAA